MAPIHCGKPCISKTLLTSSFTFISVFVNFISCGPRKVVTACETLLIVDEIDARETPKAYAVFFCNQGFQNIILFIKTSFRHTEIISPFRFLNLICQKFIPLQTRSTFLYPTGPSCSFVHGLFLHHYVLNKLPILLYLLTPLVDKEAHQHKVWLCNSQKCYHYAI